MQSCHGKVMTKAMNERELHNSILYECRLREWVVFHGSTAHRTYRTLGEPDFTIIGPGWVLFVECKTPKGKLTPEQEDLHARIRKLHHEVHVIRSVKEWATLAQFYASSKS